MPYKTSSYPTRTDRKFQTPLTAQCSMCNI